MTQTSSTGSEQSTIELTDSDWYQLLAAQERRRVLEILSDRSQPISVSDLATQVAAAETDQPPMNTTREETKEVQRTLRHIHLPKLAEAGLVTESDGTVTMTQRRALQNPKIEAILTTEAHDWDAVLGCLANERQRIVLRVLAEHGESMAQSVLAADVAETLQSDTHESVSPEEIEVGLHHQYLPKLADAGLINFDRSEGTVQYEGHPSLPEECLQTGVTHNAEAIL